MNDLGVVSFLVVHEWFNDYTKGYYGRVDTKAFSLFKKVIFPCAEAAKTWEAGRSHSVENKLIIFNGLNPSNLDSRSLIFERNQSSYAILDRITPSDFVMVICGTIDSRKNQKDFISKVFAPLSLKHAFIKLILVGDVIEARDELNLRVSDFKDKIFLTGDVQNPFFFMKRADLIISHSVNEVMPLNLIEALHFSKPIITLNAGCCSSIVRHDYNGYIYNDIGHAFFFIDKLIENTTQRLQFGGNSKLIFDEKFTHRNFESWVDLIRLHPS
jgi:glycosyltransferase involved in cell wall biosynthesis